MIWSVNYPERMLMYIVWLLMKNTDGNVRLTISHDVVSGWM